MPQETCLDPWKYGAAPAVLCCPEYESLARIAHRARYNAVPFARHCGCSLRWLQRVLKAGVHCSPKHALNSLRALEAARCILSGHTAKEAAFEFRYHDPAHFSRSLKEHVGLLPSQLRAAALGEDFRARDAHLLLRQNVAFIQHAVVALFKILQHRKSGLNSTPQVSSASPQLAK